MTLSTTYLIKPFLNGGLSNPSRCPTNKTLVKALEGNQGVKYSVPCNYFHKLNKSKDAEYFAKFCRIPILYPWHRDTECGTYSE